MSEPMSVAKYGYTVQVSAEAQAEAFDIAAAIERWRTATPEQRREWERQAERERAEERATALRVELTVDALTNRLGWSRAYAEHVVQPYCECYSGMDGWEYCQHARDLGLIP